MPGMPIILTGQEAASNSDILQGTRLQNVPANGTLTVQFAASAATVGTNDHSVSLQLPSGGTPMNGVFAPIGDSGGTTGLLDERTQFMASFTVAQGGHSVFSTVLTGTSVLSWRVVYTPH